MPARTDRIAVRLTSRERSTLQLLARRGAATESEVVRGLLRREAERLAESAAPAASDRESGRAP